MRTFMYINGNNISRIDAESIREAESVVGHGNVFMSRSEAEEVLALRNKEKVRPLSEDELKEQNEWARSMMKEEEKAQIKPKRNIEYEQFLFAMNQMGISGKEFYKRKDAFWQRYNATKQYRKSYA